MPFFRRFEVWIFFALAIALSTTAVALSVSTGNGALSILAVLSPLLAAVVVTAISRGWRGLHDLLIGHLVRRFSWKWVVAASVLVPAIALISALTDTIVSGRSFALVTTSILPYAIVIWVIAIGEEFGWRAYAMPRLNRHYPVAISGLIVGVVWAVWHVPAAMIGTGVPQQMPFVLFTVWVILGALLMGWMYTRTQSVIPAILFHASANAAFIYLPLLPEHLGVLWPFILFATLIGAIVVVVYARNRDLLVPPEQSI